MKSSRKSKPTHFLTITEAAKFLGINPMTLRRWDQTGKLKSYKTKGNHRRYRPSDLEIIAVNRAYQKSQVSFEHLLNHESQIRFESQIVHEDSADQPNEINDIHGPGIHSLRKRSKFTYAGAITLLLLVVVSTLSFMVFVGKGASDAYHFISWVISLVMQTT